MMSAFLPLWILIPAKPLAEGKSRLAAALSPQERLALTRRLLQRTLDVALSLAGVAGVVVVSADPKILWLAEQAGAQVLREERINGDGKGFGQEWGLNRAVAQAAAFVQTQAGGALLFLPADLPLLQPEDIRAVIRAWDQRADAFVIAPSYSGGTNALLLCPPQAIAPAFGVDSFARHIRLAQDKGLRISVVESPALAWDLDTPEEYRMWMGMQGGVGIHKMSGPA